MRKLWIVSVLSFVTYACSLRDTGLFTHTEGYFIKDGNHWEEYCPMRKAGLWDTYSTYDEDGEYYYISNDLCSLAVPKVSTSYFLLYEDNDWTAVFETCQIFSSFRDTGRDIYCHENGYFVRDGDDWRSYVEGKNGPVASFRTSSVDESFFYVYNDDGYMMIPRDYFSGFYVSDDEDNWEMLYYVTDVYETGMSPLSYGSGPDSVFVELPDSLCDVPVEADTMLVEPQENLEAGRGNNGSSGQSDPQAGAGQKKPQTGIKDKSSELKALYDKASAYDDKKDYGNSFPLHKQAAEQGYAPSQYRLGDMYHYGLGVAKDYSEALKWYRLAADQGDVDAQKSLGSMYTFGIGVTKDYSEAFKWYRLAADQGDAGAQHMQGAMYEYGRGVAMNRSEALKWYRLAAAQGLGLSKEAVERLESE